MLNNKTTTETPNQIEETPKPELNETIQLINGELDAKRDKLITEYEEEMKKLKNLHENEKIEKEKILKQIEQIKKEYEMNLNNMNQQIIEQQVKRSKDTVSEKEILKRIETLKASMIGGEKAHDKELSERRKRKKRAAEQRAR